MITSSEREVASAFVLSDPSNLKTALAVYESWPDVKKRVCQQFLKGLCSRIEKAVKENKKLKEFAGDMRICYKYEDKAWESKVWLYRECWIQYPVGQKLNRRTSIYLSKNTKVRMAGAFL